MDSHSDIGRVSLAQLVKHGHIDREDALACANHPDDLNSLLKS